MSVHMYVVVGGAYKDADLAAEQWQIGFRYLCTTGATPDSIGAIPDIDIVPMNHNIDETNWTITGNWTTEMGVSDFNPADWLNDQVAPALVTLIGQSNFNVNTYVQTIKCYPIGSPTGQVVPAPPYAQGSPITLTFKSQTACDGSGGGSLFPLQIAAVASLRTPQLGRRGRGRVFLAGLDTAGQENDGLMKSGTRSALATQVSTFLEATQLDSDTGGININPIVTGKPFEDYAFITSVMVGSVFDTQRRRRNQLPETYSTVTVDNPA